MKSLAVKDHSLDEGIVNAARAEFLEHGYQKASLHKIADRAGITTGALYTRYKNKDDLFCSLVRDTLQEVSTQFAPMEALYEKARQTRSADALLAAIQAEEQIYLDLLFDHYEECVLMFCKSDGSSLEKQMQQMMALKSRQTVAFFESMTAEPVDLSGIELIMSQQFSYYRQLLLRGWSREQAVSCLKTLDLFLEAGWKAVFREIL